MKDKLKAVLRTPWLLLTEVPGWVDAPFSARLGRAFPIVFPAGATGFLILWSFVWQAPHIRATREALAPLTSLAQETTTLQIAYSEQQTVDLAERASIASRLMLGRPADLGPFLSSLNKEAVARGWESQLQAGDLSGEATVAGGVIAYLPVRGKLTPANGNTETFPSLLAVLERFSTSGKRIDLMRLSIRADENRWQSVEVNLRLACPVAHEKTPQ